MAEVSQSNETKVSNKKFKKRMKFNICKKNKYMIKKVVNRYSYTSLSDFFRQSLRQFEDDQTRTNLTYNDNPSEETVECYLTVFDTEYKILKNIARENFKNDMNIAANSIFSNAIETTLRR